MRLENWTKMRGKSRVVPEPGEIIVGCSVGGEVYGHPTREDGTTMTTGTVIEIIDSKTIKTFSHNENGYSIYTLGRKMFWG